jgi:glycosyltransferase involved in cell wall biosynthesis
MNILVSTPKWNGVVSGVEYHRCLIPFKNIPNVIFTDNIEEVPPQFLKDNNIGIVWFNRNISPVNLNPDRMYKALRYMKIKIVIDIDDSWNIPFGHILYKPTVLQKRRQSAISQIQAADYVCVTHQQLKDNVVNELKVDKRKVIIAPNGIDPTELQYAQDFNYKLDNIFWQGSVTHHHDLKLISESVNELNKKIFIAGYNPESHYSTTNYEDINLEPDGHYFDDKKWIYELPLQERWEYWEDKGLKIYHWEEIGNMFNRKQWIHELPSTEYMNSYQNKGLTLIPLESSKFTACKSNLKLLESGWAKKPVIVSHTKPYLPLAKDGNNCETANTKSDWIDSIKYILENPNYADDLRFQLHEDIKENYLIDKVNQSRIELIEKICR